MKLSLRYSKIKTSNCETLFKYVTFIWQNCFTLIFTSNVHYVLLVMTVLLLKNNSSSYGISYSGHKFWSNWLLSQNYVSQNKNKIFSIQLKLNWIAVLNAIKYRSHNFAIHHFFQHTGILLSFFGWYSGGYHSSLSHWNI